ncbi:hypothetical protein FDECE_2718 [Fusarium decemcellulare]|nr:hypothetical protein FDECE_2718 [Fusarium decemcellulare]
MNSVNWLPHPHHDPVFLYHSKAMSFPIEPVTVSVASRVFTITGGASGMGAATARILAKQGAAAIHIGDWDTTKFEEITNELGAINPQTRVFTDQVDVSNPSSVKNWIKGVVDKSRAIHGCLNAAGIAQVMSDPSSTEPMIIREKDEDIDRVMNVNYKGVVYCTREQTRAMLEMPKGSHPSIVNIASLSCLMHIPGGYTYSASKAACAHFSQCVAKDVQSKGIRVNAISPGNILTPMTRQFIPADADPDLMAKQGAAAGLTFVDPHDVAKNIVWLLSEASLHVNGTNLAIGATVP